MVCSYDNTQIEFVTMDKPQCVTIQHSVAIGKNVHLDNYFSQHNNMMNYLVQFLYFGVTRWSNFIISYLSSNDSRAENNIMMLILNILMDLKFF